MQKTKVFYSLLFFLSSLTALSQYRDRNWLFGYQSGGGPGFGGTDIVFATNPPAINYHFRTMNLDAATAEISDNASGNLLFYTNGIYIANANDQQMLNGGGLNPGPLATNYANYGIPIAQGELILPAPGSTTQYYLFHVTGEYFPSGYVQPLQLFYTQIDMTLDGGLGGVSSKNNIAISDTLAMGGITAVKHGNGRDWWILIPQYHTNGYYTLLLTPSGVSQPFLQNIGFACGVFDWSGQTVFSPDGTKFARYDKDNELNIFDFDRCTGMLSNDVHITINDSAVAGGAAFSSNSRYLYITSTWDIYQFDILAAPVASSQITVAHWDGFASPFGTTFLMAALAPDGKIYINSTNGENVLGRINAPDSAGLACNVMQHSVQLPTYNALSMPNYPQYNLGKWLGSICDTIATDITAFSQINTTVKAYYDALYQILVVNASNITNGQSKLVITDVLGKIIYASLEKPLTNTLTKEISCLGWSSGIYFLNLFADDKSYTVKFVKK